MYKKTRIFFDDSGDYSSGIGDDPIQFHRDGCTGISLYGHMDSMRGAGEILYQYYEGNITQERLPWLYFEPNVI